MPFIGHFCLKNGIFDIICRVFYKTLRYCCKEQQKLEQDCTEQKNVKMMYSVCTIQIITRFFSLASGPSLPDDE